MGTIMGFITGIICALCARALNAEELEEFVCGIMISGLPFLQAAPLFIKRRVLLSRRNKDLRNF